MVGIGICNFCLQHLAYMQLKVATTLIRIWAQESPLICDKFTKAMAWIFRAGIAPPGGAKKRSDDARLGWRKAGHARLGRHLVRHWRDEAMNR
jgi:hypothetical protein